MARSDSILKSDAYNIIMMLGANNKEHPINMTPPTQRVPYTLNFLQLSLSYQHRSAMPNIAWLLNKNAIPLASPSEDMEAALRLLLTGVDDDIIGE